VSRFPLSHLVPVAIVVLLIAVFYRTMNDQERIFLEPK